MRIVEKTNGTKNETFRVSPGGLDAEEAQPASPLAAVKSPPVTPPAVPPSAPPPAKVPVSLADVLPAAQKGDADAQFEVGRMFDEGRGVKRNISVAIEWLGRSAAQRHAKASTLLGAHFLNGDPGYNKILPAERKAKARELLSIAVELKDPRGIYWMSRLSGDPRLLEASANMGDALAQVAYLLRNRCFLLDSSLQDSTLRGSTLPDSLLGDSKTSAAVLSCDLTQPIAR